MFQWPEEIPWEEYIRLYFLEKTLRWLIKNELEKITSKWWVQRVPPAVRVKADERRRDEEQSLGPTINLHPIWYTDFSSYAEIITRRDNWEELFKPIFKNRDHLRVALEMLQPIRNKIAHMKPLSPREKTNLNAFSADVLTAIWDYYNKKYVKMAHVLTKEGRPAEAEKILLEGFEKTEKDPWIAYNLGELHEETGRLEEAEKWFDYAEKHLVLPLYKKRAGEKLMQTREKIRLSRIKVCPKCGHEAPKENPFCGKCGYKF